MSVTTASDWIEEVREHLGGGVVEQVNRLAADYQPGDTTLSMQYELKGVTPGVPLNVDLNCFQVWSVTPASNEVEISSGWAGSPDVLATAGTVVRVRPNFYNHRILKAINDTIREISSPLAGVYAVGIQDIDYDPQVTVYDLSDAEDLVGILRVQKGVLTDEMDVWADLLATDWQFRKIEPVDEFPSGNTLRIHGTGERELFERDGDTIRVIYKRAFGTLDALTDDISLTVIPEYAQDLPTLGAAARLAGPQEFRRNLLNAQPDSRRGLEVPPGASQGGARALRELFMSRVQQEAARLMADYPPKSL